MRRAGLEGRPYTREVNQAGLEGRPYTGTGIESTIS